MIPVPPAPPRKITRSHEGVQLKQKQDFERQGIGSGGKIVVIHRLCQFAYELLKYALSLHATKLVVFFDNSTTDERKLSENIIAINTVFICKMQGKEPRNIEEKKKETTAEGIGLVKLIYNTAIEYLQERRFLMNEITENHGNNIYKCTIVA
ncbi:7891_t:CDS:2 [Paraglomus occultum]|uniref:7891_t:CDS:1 n=1 Tax=Paraglomus occultum TaxID=144539 RepID=A0A9N9BH86_9GLOM|nr:7891_t:CDS:2 [Paraglomus occultum]